ncbi:MAG: Hpt domain-containing protein [Planctomycetota bacterium]
MSSSSSPLRSAFADDAEFGELIGLFVAEMPDRIETIDSAVAERDMKSLQIVAHQLKGAGGGYGFSEITEAGRRLEHLAETADAEIQDDVARVTEAANALVDLCSRATAS